MSYFFEKEFTVNSHDCGVNNVLTPTGLLRCLQETANVHAENAGFGYDACLEKGRAFVLSRVAVTMYEPLFAYDRFLGRTAPCGNRGVIFGRCTELVKDGRVAAALSSVWALVDFESRALIRASESGIDLPDGDQIELSAPIKFRFPADLPFTEAGTFTVGQSVCDRNSHMNNTRYPDMLCDFLPPLTGKRIAELSLYYPSEARLGEKLTVLSAVDPQSGAVCFRTVRQSDGKTNVEARMLFTDL